MAQNSDNEGFLVGDPVTSLRRSGAGQTDSLLYDIRAEIRSVRQTILDGVARPLSLAGRPAVSPRPLGSARALKSAITTAPAVPAGRVKGARALAKSAVTASPVSAAVPSGQVKGSRSAAQSAEALPAGAAARRALAATTPPAKPGQRDGKGRFVKREGSTSEGAPSPDAGSGGSGAVRNLAERISAAIGPTSGLEEADPTAKAFNEVVAPFSRGLDVLGRKSDGRQEGLLKRIWKTLKGIEEKAVNPAQAESGGGIFMLLGRFLPLLLPALVGLTAVVAGVKAFLGIKGLLEDDEKAAKAAEDIKKDVAEPLKDNLKAVGIDSDKRIADTRAATLERRDGEYAKEDQARAAFAASSGMKPGSTTFEDAFYKDQQAKEAAAAEQAKKGVFQRGVEKVKEVGRSLFGNRHKDAMVSQMAASGITDPKEQAMFLAQLDHESGGFSKMEERFNYKSAARLMQVSGSARKQGQPAVEQAMAQGPEAVAELMYGGRMGNKSPGDAYAFRGRGAIQLTGRENYARAGKALGIDLANHPELAAEPENSAKIAAWYWKTNKLSTAAKNGDVRAVTKTINGGANGLDDRTAKFGKYLSAAKAGAFNVSPATASIPAARPVRAPSMPAIAEAPAMQVPLGSGAPSGPVMVSLQGGDVRQDLSDRRMAHIATGGVAN